MSQTTTVPPVSPGPSPVRQVAGLRTPLRVLGVGLSLLLVAWGALTLASLLARTTEQRSATYDGVRVLELDVGFESAQIVGSADATSVSMTRSYTWSMGKPVVGNRRDGDVLSITSSCPFSVGLGCSGRIRLVVPQDVEVRAQTSDGSLTVRDLDGTADLSASDGSIRTTNLTGRVTLHSSDGSIEATGLRSDRVGVTTSDGSVRLGFDIAPTSLTATSSDGSVEIVVPRDGTAYDMTVTTSDGSRNVSVPTRSGSAHRMELHTSDGSIRVTDRP
ncbi:MAG: hypothetical protein QOE19_3674 [Actinomycetota bacterium]|jgi:hypothetical protein|nr:hypothetical protein [Actinomycetota bacterium]